MAGVGGEKSQAGVAWTAQVPPRRRQQISKAAWFRSLVAASVGLVVLSRSFAFVPLPGIYNGLEEVDKESILMTKDFKFEDIVPTKELVYHDCLGEIQCARLEVPMNYKRTDGKGGKVAVAMARLPAKVPVTDPRYGGAIILEPGGPGGSGVEMVMWFGKELQRIADSPVDPSTPSLDSSDKYFDVIGFDPRGVNNTTPAVRCFPDQFSAQNWRLQQETMGILGSSENNLHTHWRRARALAAGCSASLTEGSDGDAIGEHINTTPVVEDMVQMIERHGEWREKQAVAAERSYAKTHGIESTNAMLARTKWNKGKEKILYWGFSYGTVIGAVFSAMHPERVSRLILDGVVDADDFHNGPWHNNLGDTDGILTRFFHLCYEAGPQKCSFYHKGGPDAIKAAYDKLLADIYNDPLEVPASANRGPEVITWSDVKSAQSPGLYQPLQLFPHLANLLSDIATGNGSKFADFKHSYRIPTCPTLDCSSEDTPCRAAGAPLATPQATEAVLCTDAVGLGDIDEASFKEYWLSLRNQSEAMGDFWAHTRLGCIGWKAKAKWRFAGPFTGQTAHPLLLIGNTLDPVTPIRNARKISAQFPGSVVIEHHAEGHCSFTAPSTCTMSHVRNYFQTGRLPTTSGGEVMCETNVKPLLDGPVVEIPTAAIGEDNDITFLARASKKFAERGPKLHLGH